MMTTFATVVERRGADRRRQATPMWSRYSILGGRRQDFRRKGEVRGAFVDNHGAFLFLVVTALAMWNILDAFFTVLFLSYGGVELNPVVAMSLEHGIWAFLGLKSLGIGLCAAFLTMTKNFWMARLGLAVVFVGYTVLMGWHAWLYLHLDQFAG